MIIRTTEVSPDGGQAGAAIYEYYSIQSKVNDLRGWGMYMHDSEDIAAWCEVSLDKTVFFINQSVTIQNKDVAWGNFVEYVKSKLPNDTIYEVKVVDSSNR